MTKFVIGTASNSIFFPHLQQMLYSLRVNLPEQTTVLILDNGLRPFQVEILKKHFGFLKLIFYEKQLTQYEKSSYLFKTFIHEIALEQYTNHIYLWMDSMTTLKADSNKLLQMLEVQPVYSLYAFDEAESKWTDKRTMDIIGLNDEQRQTPQFQAGGQIHDLRNIKAIEFLSTLIKYNYQKECITPEGSSRKSHRQDQSVFSCLLKKWGYVIPPNLWATCHNRIF